MTGATHDSVFLGLAYSKESGATCTASKPLAGIDFSYCAILPRQMIEAWLVAGPAAVTGRPGNTVNHGVSSLVRIE